MLKKLFFAATVFVALGVSAQAQSLMSPADMAAIRLTANDVTYRNQMASNNLAGAVNEQFLDTYGSFTGMTPGPVEVPFGSLYTGGLGGGSGGKLDFQLMESMDVIDNNFAD